MKTINKTYVKPNKIILYNSYHYTELWKALSYRTAKQITQIHVRPINNGFAICPTCYCTLEREYVNFCNNCGQMLGWETYSLFNIRAILLNNKTYTKTIILSKK